jgi:guanosine-3',5'-bis(diphosphate) 3'-pyrophosphohydrolase
VSSIKHNTSYLHRLSYLHYHYTKSGDEMEAKDLLDKARQYLPPEKVALVEAAYNYAAKAHAGQIRQSGDPYVEHPLQTAMTLADLQLDAATLAAALLHDVSEDCNIPQEEIEAKFGTEVSKLVEGVTKLSKLSWQKTSETKQKSQAENLRKMLIAMAEDLRVVFIKLADRLHNMGTLGALSPERRRKNAIETLEIYAPLAHRLGIWEVKWQLEDLAFRYLEPKKYHQIARMVSTRRKQRESYITEVIGILKAELEKEGLKAEVFGRPKHIYSIYQKINRYSAIGKDFNDIHDLFALRVLVDTIPDCYRAMGIIHNLWHPLPDEFNDHIANPKDNGYQSLHTTVLSMGRTPLEIQIRTFDMHRVADYGVAAHWRYKETSKQDKHFEEKVTWLRQLIDWQTELDSEQFMESVKTDIFIDQVFVYTPKGEIKALPRGATPLDFAYFIHTELGHRCIGAKVNGRMVQLNHTLRNGDIVEIMSTKVERGPSLDWLNADIGYVKTSHAREKIRQWFKKQERTQNIERGKQLLERELKRTGISLPNAEDTAKLFNCDSYDDFLAAIGQGIITQRQFVLTLTKESEPEPEIIHKTPPIIKKYDTTGVQVMGVGDLLTHLAACCSPLPGDDIVGYITRSHGITVHRKDCVNIINLKERERLIDVSWGKTQEVYLVHIHIDAWDRLGLLRDITTLVADEKVNIMGINLTEIGGDNVAITADLEIRDMTQLHRLLNKIRAVRGVNSVDRSNPAQVGLNS